jgi:hypothetical protein
MREVIDMTDNTSKSSNNRLEILLARFADKKNGSINTDLMVVINTHAKVENIKMQLRIAEAELSHALRGLEHKDYDTVFEGWSHL